MHKLASGSRLICKRMKTLPVVFATFGGESIYLQQSLRAGLEARAYKR